MRTIKKIILILLLLSLFFFVNSCGAGHVTVGVGVYVPGAWGPYGGYYPPVGVGIGYPIY